MSERAKVCIDRILPRDLMRFQPTTRGREGRVRAISPIGKTWMNGSTLHLMRDCVFRLIPATARGLILARTAAASRRMRPL